MNEITIKVEKIVRHTFRQEGFFSAMKVLREQTGWGLKEAKDWLDNCNEQFTPAVPPCPYCGRRLRSPQAKQCRRCLRDWHDESNIVRLGTIEPWTADI